MNWKVKLEGRVRTIKKSRYNINNKKLSTIYQTAKILVVLAQWWEKYLLKHSPLKHACSWRDKLIALWILNRQAKIFLTYNKSIILIRQDKNRSIVILDRKNHFEKCLSIVENKQLRKLKKDSTKTESKVQRTLRKIESMLSENNYKKLYATGSQPGLFYWMAKVYKLHGKQGLNELTVRPVIYTIGTATDKFE